MNKQSYINSLNEDWSKLLEPGKKAFMNVANKWQLQDKHILKILPVDLPQKERLIAMSATLGIYESLHIIFSNSVQADSWVHRANTQSDGLSALEFICEHCTEGL